MASGVIDLGSSGAMRGQIVWSAVIDINSNSSAVTARLQVCKGSAYTGTTGTFSGSLQIASNNKNGTYYGTVASDWVTVVTHERTVYHEPDGTGSCYIYGKITGPSGTTLAGVSVSGDATVALDQIPRTSSFAATDAAIGSVSTITIDRESTNLHHRIKVEFGTVTGYVTNAGGFSTSESTITGASVGFTIPNDFYYAIPNATKGACKMTLYTLSGSVVVGDEVTIEIEITTVSSRCNPTLTIEVNHDNSATSNLTGSNSAFIRGYSNARCNVRATGRYGATITRIWTNSKYTDNGNGSYTISPLEAETITFYAQDSRGYTGSVSTTVTLVPYIVLTNNAIAGRPNPTDGSAYVQFQGQYFNDTFGSVRNTLSIRYKVEYPDGSIDANWKTVTATISNSAYSAYISFSGFDYTKTYKIHTIVVDKLLTLEKVIHLKQGIPVFDWGKNDFQFNVPVYIQGYTIMPEILFIASESSGSSGDVTLSANVSDFTYIEIFYCDNNGRGSGSVKVLAPEGKQVALHAIEPNGQSAFYFRRSGYNISGNKIMYAGNGGYAYFNGSSWTTYTGNYIRITGVVGYHRSAAGIAPVLSPIIEQSALASLVSMASVEALASMAMHDDLVTNETEV